MTDIFDRDIFDPDIFDAGSDGGPTGLLPRDSTVAVTVPSLPSATVLVPSATMEVES